jgi:hypothetical protein
VKKENKLEAKIIPVDGITKAKEIFENIKIGDKIHWETHNGVDKYDGVVIEKNSKYFYAITRRYVKETPEWRSWGGISKSYYGNSIREKGFELTEEDKIWYKGDYGNIYFENQFREIDKEYFKQDQILKKAGL